MVYHKIAPPGDPYTEAHVFDALRPFGAGVGDDGSAVSLPPHGLLVVE